jgi:hypothetical protein
VIDTFSLAVFGATPNGEMTVDSIRGRIYVIETLPVAAMCVSNKDRLALQSTADAQPQLQPALLRLSAMISQYFTQRIVPGLLSGTQA